MLRSSTSTRMCATSALVMNPSPMLALTDGQSLLEAVRFATISSGLKVTKVGGQKGIPTLDELNDFCLKNGLSHYLLDNASTFNCTPLHN